MMFNKNAFKVGDKVFDIRFGWGIVSDHKPVSTYKIEVTFDEGIEDFYTDSGFHNLETDLVPMLSYTEYTFQGSSQERPESDKLKDFINELSEEERFEMIALLKYG